VLLDPVDRRLIERCAHREEALVPDLIPESLEFFKAQPGLLEALDVRELGRPSIGRVDECIEIAVLQLKGERVRKVLSRLAERLDYRTAVLQAPHVVVCEFEHEQRPDVSEFHGVALLG
jgi:hypothetical protein